MKSFWDRILKDDLLLYCGIYTLATILKSVLYLTDGIYEDPNGNWHEINRAGIVLIGVHAVELCLLVKVKNILVNALIGYVPTML